MKISFQNYLFKGSIWKHLSSSEVLLYLWAPFLLKSLPLVYETFTLHGSTPGKKKSEKNVLLVQDWGKKVDFLLSLMDSDILYASEQTEGAPVLCTIQNLK